MTAPNVMAHLPATSERARYRLGPQLQTSPDDVWFNTTWPDGVRIVAAEPTGWEGITFVTPLDTAGGRDGGLVGPQSVAPRILSVQGAMVGPDARTLRLAIRRLRGLLGPRSSVVWDQYDFGMQVRMGLVCRGTGDFTATPIKGNMEGGVATQFAFTLVAPTPWKYATGVAEQRCVGLPSAAVTGRTYNMTFPYNYGSVTNPGGMMEVNNRGDMVAWPVFRIEGPVITPIVTNETTGQAFLVSGDVPASDPVTIDSRTGVVTPSHYRLVGRPWSLAPGINTIRWRASVGSFNPSAQLCLTWRSTWE